MLRIVVFDGGLGGEMVADYLASELGVVEVVCEIDWQHAPYEERTLEEIFEFAREAIAPYVGYAEVIVLGGYTSSLALGYLRRAFPEQLFVAMPVDYRPILSACRKPEPIMFMASEVMLESSVWTDLQKNLSHVTLVAPDCSGWEWQLDCGRMTIDMLRADLGPYFELADTRPSYNGLSIFATDPTACALDDFGLRQTEVTPLREQIIRFLGRDFSTRPNLAFAAAGMDDFISPVPLGPDTQSIAPAPAATEVSPEWERLSPSVIVLLDTHFWAIREELQELFGYGVRIIDFRKQLLHNVCVALKLKGLDGNIACQY